MENSEKNSVVEALRQFGNGDAWTTETFGLVRESPTHGHQIVTVEVFERATGPGNRYHAVATSETGQRATGNSAETLDVVLATLHWEDLDK